MKGNVVKIVLPCGNLKSMLYWANGAKKFRRLIHFIEKNDYDAQFLRELFCIQKGLT